MALIQIKLPRLIAWQQQDKLALYVGTEGAVSLAASTPSGGTKVLERRVFGINERGGFGLDESLHFHPPLQLYLTLFFGIDAPLW